MRCWRVLIRSASLHGDHGFTLIEAIVALALTVTVALVVTSVIITTLTSQRRLLQQTDDYESLRVAATKFMQDARYANRCGLPDWDELRLYSASSSYVEYKFKERLSDGSVQADPNHLHRWVYTGGNFQSDEIVGWNLVPPSFDTPIDGSRFECEFATYSRNAAVILLKPPLPGQATATQLRVSSYQRS